MSILVSCNCGKKWKLNDDKAGKRIRCPECQQVFVAKAPSPTPPAESPEKLASTKTCPSCKTDLPADTVVCIDCGLNLLTGVQLSTSFPDRRKKKLAARRREHEDAELTAWLKTVLYMPACAAAGATGIGLALHFTTGLGNTMFGLPKAVVAVIFSFIVSCIYYHRLMATGAFADFVAQMADRARNESIAKKWRRLNYLLYGMFFVSGLLTLLIMFLVAPSEAWQMPDSAEKNSPQAVAPAGTGKKRAKSSPKVIGPAVELKADPKADPTGIWKVTTNEKATTTDGAAGPILKLIRNGDKLTGVMIIRDNKESPIEDGKFKDGEIQFKIVMTVMNQTVVLKYSGKVSEDTMKGRAEFEVNGQLHNWTWDAKRVMPADQ